MNSTAAISVQPERDQVRSIKAYLDSVTDDLLASLPAADELTSSGRRGMIARYAAVLEGNFIYWMTGAYLAAASEEARAIITDNLLEEVRDSHPAMLRRFVVAANALPTEEDVLAVAPKLLEVRLFVGRLATAPILAMMAFFESFIQRYMSYLEQLAKRQGSTEVEYTQVHGVCDIAHSEGLFHALGAELTSGSESDSSLYEGVHLLRGLMEDTFHGQSRLAA